MNRARTLTIAFPTICFVLFACEDQGIVGPSDASSDADDGGVVSADATPDAADVAIPSPEIDEWLALVRGELFTDDLTEAQSRHDGVAAAGREAAMMAGDFAHDPMLGTALLGTTPNAFLATDRWVDGDAMQGFYSDPTFAAAFGELFAAPPELELFERRSDFHEWGDLDAADLSDVRYFVVVRGRFASVDLSESRAAHDAVASGGEEMVRMAGDVAHVVYLRMDDPREFLAIDVWGDDTAIEAVYGNPDFQAAFAALFVEPPSVGVYRSSDWESW